MGEKLRVGVLGVGYLGRIHARIYAGMKNVELVGVADVDQSAANTVASQCGCQAYFDSSEMVDKVDGVSIVVPTSLHQKVAEPFLHNGVHVMMEKPLASTVDQAQQVVALAEKNGVVLQVGHLERFNAGVMSLADQVSDPRFIEVHRLGTFVERATDVDVVTDLMIHDIDIVLSLVNADLRSVSAVGSPVVTDHVDIANARLEFENHAVANVTASRVSSKKFRRIRVFARSQYLALNFNDQQLEVVETGDTLPGKQFPEIVHKQVEVTPRPPLDAELEHFVQTVNNGAKPLVSGRDGVEALRVAEKVKQKIHDSMTESIVVKAD